MFHNLESKQRQLGYTDKQIADFLGISENQYIDKKQTGMFSAYEAKKLCTVLKESFVYLFVTNL